MLPRRLCLLAIVLLLPAVTPRIGALELWTEGVPELPAGASRTTTTRVVTHRNGRETVARARMYDRLVEGEGGRVLRDVFDERGRLLWTTEFTIREGRLVSVRAVDDEGTRWDIRFEYDDLGRIVREAHTRASGDSQRIVAYEYSSDGIEIVAYRGDGTVAWRRTETTGAIQDERETTYFYADGSRVKTIIASIDEQGRATREQHYDELGAVYRSVSRDFEDDRLVHEVVTDDTAAVIRETEWDYDRRGLLRERTVELPDDSVVERLTITYEFDDRGHWIRQTHTTVAELPDETSVITDRFLLEREIEYR